MVARPLLAVAAVTAEGRGAQGGVPAALRARVAAASSAPPPSPGRRPLQGGRSGVGLTTRRLSSSCRLGRSHRSCANPHLWVPTMGDSRGHAPGAERLPPWAPAGRRGSRGCWPQ